MYRMLCATLNGCMCLGDAGHVECDPFKMNLCCERNETLCTNEFIQDVYDVI